MLAKNVPGPISQKAEKPSVSITTPPRSKMTFSPFVGMQISILRAKVAILSVVKTYFIIIYPFSYYKFIIIIIIYLML
jgi:hypothetical protein